jgi:putative redox protein
VEKHLEDRKQENDMANPMTVRAVLQEGMRFDAETDSGHSLILDASTQNGGQEQGPSPMEVLLIALATCASMDVLSILRKKRQQITAYEVRVHGERTEEHPRIFTDITVEHILTGHAILPQAVERAIALTEERYCPVGVIVGRTARITHTFQLHEAL